MAASAATSPLGLRFLLLEEEDEDEVFVFVRDSFIRSLNDRSACNLFLLRALPLFLPLMEFFLLHSSCFSRSALRRGCVNLEPSFGMVSKRSETTRTASWEAPLQRRDNALGSAGIEPSRQQ